MKLAREEVRDLHDVWEKSIMGSRCEARQGLACRACAQRERWAACGGRGGQGSSRQAGQPHGAT